MAYKLLDMAQARWRRLDGAHLLPLERAGIAFVDGIQRKGKVGKRNAKAAEPAAPILRSFPLARCPNPTVKTAPLSELVEDSDILSESSRRPS